MQYVQYVKSLSTETERFFWSMLVVYSILLEYSVNIFRLSRCFYKCFLIFIDIYVSSYLLKANRVS